MATTESFQPPPSFVNQCRQLVSRGYYKVQSVMPALKAFREYIQVRTCLGTGTFPLARPFIVYVALNFADHLFSLLKLDVSPEGGPTDLLGHRSWAIHC